MGQTDLRLKGTPVDTLNADGTWDRIHEVLLDKLRGADRINWSRALVDSSISRAVSTAPQASSTTSASCSSRSPSASS